MVGCQPKGGERGEQLARRVSGFWARVQACLHDAGAPLATLHLIGYAYTSCGRSGVCCPAIVVLAVPLDCLFGTAGNLGSEENYHSAKPKEGHLVLIGMSVSKDDRSVRFTPSSSLRYLRQSKYRQLANENAQMESQQIKFVTDLGSHDVCTKIIQWGAMYSVTLKQVTDVPVHTKVIESVVTESKRQTDRSLFVSRV